MATQPTALTLTCDQGPNASRALAPAWAAATAVAVRAAAARLSKTFKTSAFPSVFATMGPNRAVVLKISK